jgi:hypothetical protein
MARLNNESFTIEIENRQLMISDLLKIAKTNALSEELDGKSMFSLLTIISELV